MSRTSLAEAMGTTASQGLSLDRLPEILGEAMPDLPRNGVGRHRLIRSLRNRFGSNFRSLPGVTDLVKEFDGEIQYEAKLNKLRQIKAKGK